MSKKLIYLVSFVLVLGLALTSEVEAADPSLVGWWKFDENSGNIAKDSSGNGNDGTFQGNPLWLMLVCSAVRWSATATTGWIAAIS